MSEAAATGADPITAFWNDVLAPKFERFRNVLMDGLGYHSEAPLRALALAPGTRALDVGCGWGDTAIALARKVGPGGEAIGVDCCDTFLDTARASAAAEGVRNVRFVCADVATHRFDASHDFCFSRFGTLFFANPVAAMRNIGSALRPGATAMFIAWRALADNPCWAVPKETVLRYLPRPGENAQTCGPGPFSMADPDVVRAQLVAAGFEDVQFARHDCSIMMGSDVEQALAFQLAIGPAGEIVREAGEQAQRLRQRVEDALREALAPYTTERGVVMPSSSWTITARKPG
jgi:ubiquinone/menaquinone biosynthesis C-methylase UbiE